MGKTKFAAQAARGSIIFSGKDIWEVNVEIFCGGVKGNKD